MSVKIRLQRHGRKKRAHYHIVVSDSRSPRDGRFIEKLGTYDPYHAQAKVSLNFDNALNWIRKGAEPSDTCRIILTREGVIYKNHLLKGVTKGALTEKDAEQKFNDWLGEKDKKAEEKIKKDEKKRQIRAKAKADAKVKTEEPAAKVAETAPAAEATEAAPAAETEEKAAVKEEKAAPAAEAGDAPEEAMKKGNGPKADEGEGTPA